MSRFTKLALSHLALSTLLLTGCSEGSPSAQTTDESAGPAWVLVSAPEGARSVAEAKSSAKEGDQIVLRGRIGGRKAPLTEGSAVFTMMDTAIPSCADRHPDACSTPWDYCCETPDSLTANSATVQILDAHGQPITESPETEGLAALDEVIVVGTVAPRPSESVLTVRATGVYRVGG